MKLIILIVLSASFCLSAQTLDQQLDSADVVVAPSAIETISTNEKQHTLLVGTGFKFQNYVLKGDGLTSDFPLETGFLINLGYEGKIKNRSIKTYLSTYQLDYANSNLTPSQFTVKKTEFEFIYMTDAKIFNYYDLGVGIYYDKRDVDQTSPDQIMSTRAQHGLLFHIENLNQNGSSAFYQRMQLGIPFYFNEQQEKSGSYKYGFNLEYGVELRYRVVEWQEWSAGFYADWKYFTYSGPGEKGSLNAKESELGFSIPLNLRIRF